jgi:hypothetical protein
MIPFGLCPAVAEGGLRFVDFASTMRVVLPYAVLCRAVGLQSASVLAVKWVANRRGANHETHYLTIGPANAERLRRLIAGG